MTEGRRYLLDGEPKLVRVVADALIARGAQVDVLEHNGDLRGDLESIDVVRCDGVIALHDQDLENLKLAATTHEIAPDVPVVVRTFQPELADAIQGGLNIRRAYSTSALSAPAIVGAVLAEEVLETLRLGPEEILICRLRIPEDSVLAGKTATQIRDDHHCGVIAAMHGDDWRVAPDDVVWDTGAELVVGGPLMNVLRLAAECSPLRRPQARPARTRPPKQVARTTYIRRAAVVLGLIFLAIALTFVVVLHLSIGDALFHATTTTLGTPTIADTKWVRILDTVGMLSGGALVGVLIAYLAGVVTAERLQRPRRVGRMKDHIIIVGLGTVGYRVQQMLRGLGFKVIVVEQSEHSRFVADVSRAVPIVIGDVRLADTMERVRIRQARAFVACTEDEVTNIGASLRANRSAPGVRTVARVTDRSLAQHLGTLGISALVSTTEVSASAFVSAATDVLAARSIPIGDLRLEVFRYDVDHRVTESQIREWRASGVRLLAILRANGTLEPPTADFTSLDAGDTAIVAGTSGSLRSLVSA